MNNDINIFDYFKNTNIAYAFGKDYYWTIPLFENIDNSDTYITYYVYIVKEQDTIDSIMEKYHIDKETISLYNNLEEIKPGTKLIIPNKNE